MTLIPNPEPYKWKPNECDEYNIPYVKKAPVVLEKSGRTQDFLTQTEVDEAWETGWHDTGRPQTADMVENVSKESSEPAGWTKKRFSDMNKADLMEYGKEFELNLTEDMTNDDMRKSIRDAKQTREQIMPTSALDVNNKAFS